MENHQIAAIFNEMADLLEIKGDTPFRIRAYRRAAEAVRQLPEDAATMLRADTLGDIPGIGSGTLERIRQIVDSGDCDDRRELARTVPPGLLELLEVEGVGPRTVALVHRELGIGSLDELEAMARADRIAPLPRMGARSQTRLLQAIEAHRRRAGRIRLGDALPLGQALVQALALLPGVQRVELAGSSRRRRATIGDLDVLVAATEVDPVMDRFVALPGVAQTLLRGETRCSVKLEQGLQVDLRVVELDCFGAALHHFTGSQLHNVAIRDRGKRRGLRINEYGVFRAGTGRRVGGARERDVFEAVGLPPIPPELREARGEIEAAEAGALPALVEERDLRGDLHMHTDATDGRSTLREMVEAAAARGHEYVAITDHSRALVVTRGLDEERLERQVRRIRALEQELGTVRIFAGIEVDILADGELDLPPPVLERLDWVIASVHSSFDLPREAMTGRLLRAMRSGVVDCLGHPSGRLLGRRDGYAVDLDRVIQQARELGMALELNSFPDRLDLDARRCRQARELGVPVVINSDAHHVSQLQVLRYGVYTARRGWLEPGDVLNAGGVAAIERFSARRHSSARGRG